MARLANLIISIAFVFLLDDDAFLPVLALSLENDMSLFHHAWLEAHLGQRGVRWPLFDLDSRLDWVLKRSDHLAKYTRFERAEFAELCSRLGIDIDSREKHHFKYCPVHRCVLLNVFFWFRQYSYFLLSLSGLFVVRLQLDDFSLTVESQLLALGNGEANAALGTARRG